MIFFLEQIQIEDTNKIEEISDEPEIKEETEETTEVKAEPTKEEEVDEDFPEIEKNVLEIIKEIEGEEGAQWDSITESCEKKGIDKDTIEEALTSLMDKGLIYEPVLGTIKTT